MDSDATADDTVENILLKTVGGLVDGETRVVPITLTGWPPALTIKNVEGWSGGQYVRDSYSAVSERPASDRLMRGAQYVWVENA